MVSITCVSCSSEAATFERRRSVSLPEDANFSCRYRFRKASTQPFARTRSQTEPPGRRFKDCLKQGLISRPWQPWYKTRNLSGSKAAPSGQRRTYSCSHVKNETDSRSPEDPNFDAGTLSSGDLRRPARNTASGNRSGDKSLSQSC